MTVVGTYVPYVTGCFECDLLSNGDRRRNSEDHAVGRAAVLDGAHQRRDGPDGGRGRAHAAPEAIYLLIGLTPRTLGRTLNQNLLMHDEVVYLENPRRPDCPLCGDGPRTAGA